MLCRNHVYRVAQYTVLINFYFSDNLPDSYGSLYLIIKNVMSYFRGLIVCGKNIYVTFGAYCKAFLFAPRNRELVVQSDVFIQNYSVFIIFIDPPYGRGFEKEALKFLLNSHIVEENTLIIIETEKGEDISYMESFPCSLEKVKEYKTNQHIFLRVQAVRNG